MGKKIQVADLGMDVSAAWSEAAQKLAKEVNDDWAKSTKWGEARCKVLLAKAKECHKCTATGCSRPGQNCASMDWVSKWSTYETKLSWERTKDMVWKGQKVWYNKAYERPPGGGLLVHRAGLHTVSGATGEKLYVCASWTAVCTTPKNLAQAQCRSARLVLGGGRPRQTRMNKLREKLPHFSCDWISAEAMATHIDLALRIILPQFG